MVAKLPSNEKKGESASLLSSSTAYASKLLRSWITKVLQSGPIPQHIAFIMDGNRRFASSLKKSSTAGHEYGYLKVRKWVESHAAATLWNPKCPP